MKTYKFYADPGHGWLAVKVSELMQLSIITKISGYSYVRGSTVYLEEDCDAHEFTKAYKEKHGHDIKYVHKTTDKNSSIRSYERFNANKAIDMVLMQGRKNND